MACAEIEANPHDVCVIIPAYEAASTLKAVLNAIPEWVRAIVVVDDGSRDGTADVAAATGDPRVSVVRHPNNRGVGAAMVTGYRHALATPCNIFVKVDADGQMDLNQLDRLIGPLVAGSADYSKGNRFHTGAHLRGMPLARLLGNAFLSFLTKLSSGAWGVFDPCNGYTAIHRAALEELDLEKLHPRYFFESSMLVVLTVVRAVIADVPMPARYGDEKSHLSLTRTAIQFPFLHLYYALWRFLKQYILHDFNACSILTLVGLPVFLFGAIDGVALWIHSNVTNTFAATGTIMIPTLATILGFQMLLNALILDVQSVSKVPLQSISRSRSPGAKHTRPG